MSTLATTPWFDPPTLPLGSVAPSSGTPALPPGVVTPPAFTVDMAVVFAIIVLAVALFVTGWLAPDVTALLTVVLLVVFEPWTTIGPADGIAGFASPATITVLMMFVLSEGIRRTGAVQILAEAIASFSAGSERRRLGSILGVSGISAGFIG